MPIVTVKNGRAELRNDRGTLVRTIGTNVIDADVSDEYLVIVTAKGTAELRSATGTPIRVLVPRDCVGCCVSGGNIVLRMANGRSQLRSSKGTLMRTF